MLYTSVQITKPNLHLFFFFLLKVLVYAWDLLLYEWSLILPLIILMTSLSEVFASLYLSFECIQQELKIKSIKELLAPCGKC